MVIALSGSALAQPAGEGAEAPPAAEAARPAPAAETSETAELEPAELSDDAAALQARLHAQLGRPGGLTSQEAARRAADTSLQAAARDSDVDAAEADVDKALVEAFPRLTLIARYTRLSAIEEPSLGFGGGGRSLLMTDDPDGQVGVVDPTTDTLFRIPASALSFSFPQILNQYYLQAGVNIPLSDYLLRTRQAVAAARHSKQSAKLQARAARQASAAQARAVYYNWVRARLQLVVVEQTLAQVREQHRIAKLLFEGGRGSRADMLRAESLVANAELGIGRARKAVVLTEDQLRTVMHDEASRNYEIGEDVTARASRLDHEEDLQRLLTEARRNRLELRAMDEWGKSLRQARRVVKAGNLPRLEGFANAYYANPHPRYIPAQEQWNASWDAGLQLTWSPNDYGTSNATASNLDAQMAKVRAERRALEDTIRADVIAAHQGMQEARLAMKTAETGLVAAEEGYRVRRKLFQYGRASTVEVVDAETTLLAARLDRVNAQVDLLIAKALLDHAVGREKVATR